MLEWLRKNAILVLLVIVAVDFVYGIAKDIHVAFSYKTEHRQLTSEYNELARIHHRLYRTLYGFELGEEHKSKYGEEK